MLFQVGAHRSWTPSRRLVTMPPRFLAANLGEQVDAAYPDTADIRREHERVVESGARFFQMLSGVFAIPAGTSTSVPGRCGCGS
jgi:hypothetical protein